MLRRLLLVLGLAYGCVGHAMEAQFQTVIVYNNGVNNTLAEAVFNRNLAYATFAFSSAPIGGEVVTSENAYNPSFGAFAQLDFVEVALQIADENEVDLESVLNVFSDLQSNSAIAASWTDWLNLEFRRQFDTSRFTALYQRLVDEGKRVIIFAHSQGNLFANAAYSAMDDNYNPYVGIIGVATPSSGPPSDGRGQYVTACQDLVIFLTPNAAPCTVTNSIFTITLPFIGSGDPLGHSFSNYYTVGGTDTLLQIELAQSVIAGLVDFPVEVVPGPLPPPTQPPAPPAGNNPPSASDLGCSSQEEVGLGFFGTYGCVCSVCEPEIILPYPNCPTSCPDGQELPVITGPQGSLNFNTACQACSPLACLTCRDCGPLGCRED